MSTGFDHDIFDIPGPAAVLSARVHLLRVSRKTYFRRV